MKFDGLLCFVPVEDVAQKINAGDIDEVIALGLEPVLLEQSQRVAELLSSGQLNLTVKNQMTVPDLNRPKLGGTA